MQNAPEPQANHAAQELLEAAQQSLVTQNVYVLRSCNDVIEEVGVGSQLYWVGTASCHQSQTGCCGDELQTAQCIERRGC